MKRRMRFLAIAAGMASIGCAAAALTGEGALAAALLLMSMVVCGLVLRSARPAGSPGVVMAIGALLSVLAVVAALVVATGYLQVTTPAAFLLLAAFGLCALTVVLWIASSWLPTWPYREAAALGLLTVALSALSLHGLNLITSTPAIPSTNGYVLLYADQSAGEHLYLNVGVTPSPGHGAPTSEFLLVVNPFANKPASWALLMTGDARLRNIAVDHTAIHEQVLTGRAVTTGVLSEAPGQLLWGRLPAGGTADIQGQPLTSWTSHTPAQTAVSLPDFAPGSILNTDTVTMAAIARDLGTPGLSPGGISIAVDAGSVSPLDTVVNAIPPLTDPYHLSWRFTTEVAPAYTLLDQTAQDNLNNYTFALAVLLGVAGSGLLASVQALIKAPISKKDSSAAE
jgi:hypothetical protein